MRKLLTFLLLLLAGTTAIMAQNCTGSLGDPAFIQTFGSGTAQVSQQQLGTSITNMTYQFSTACPSDGQYQIANKVNGSNTCNASTWHTVLQDHTGNPGGYFMLINAATDANIFYTQTVTGLCPGSSYQLSAWILNLCNFGSSSGGIDVDVIYTITAADGPSPGATLQTYDTGPISYQTNLNIPATWYEEKTVFAVPPGVTSVRMVLSNKFTGGNGNDLLLDDITFRPIGAAIAANIVGVTGSSLTICSDATDNYTLSAVVDNCIATPIYQWQVSTDNAATWSNIPGATNLTYTRTPTPGGTYMYRLLLGSAANAGSTSCSVASGILTINVNPAYPVSVDVVADPGNAVCTGSTVTFTATPTNGGTSPSYQWYLNGNPVGFNGPIYSNSGFVTGDIVKCVLTSSYPCTKPATSTPITMTVNPPTVTSVSIVAATDTICAGNTATFTATPVNGGTTPTYQWTVSGVVQTGNTSNVFSTSSLVDKDQVQCTMMTSLGCASPAVSNIINMTVNAIVTPTVTIVSSVNNVCSKTPVTFTATPTNGGTTPAYQWLVNGSPVGGNSSTYTTSNLANTDVVTCVLTSSYACVSSPTATSNPITMVITPLVPLSVTITADTTAICKGDPVLFTTTVVNGGTGPTYQWQVNGQNVGNNKASFASNNLNNGDKVTCIVSGNDNCAANAADTSNTITMTVYPLPVIVMEQGSTIFAGTSVPLTPEVYGTISSYLWTPATGLDNNKIQQPIATPDTTTTYTLKVTTDHNCEATSSITIIVLRAIKIPNVFSPNGDGINDTWNIDGLQDYSGCTVDIYNRYGQRVYHSLGYGTPWNGMYNNKPLPVATYYYVIDPKNGIGVLSGYVVILK